MSLFFSSGTFSFIFKFITTTERGLEIILSPATFILHFLCIFDFVLLSANKKKVKFKHFGVQGAVNSKQLIKLNISCTRDENMRLIHALFILKSNM